MLLEPTIPPTPLCFSCGNILPPSDFDLYHYTVKSLMNKHPEDAAIKITLDSKLSKPYLKICCRSMFLGDPYEYRKKMAMYDLSTLNQSPLG